MGVSPVTVTRHIQNLRGSSNPFLAEASDGHLYVVKPIAKHSSYRLFNEAMGTELYRAVGLNVPAWRPLLLTSKCVRALVGNKDVAPSELEPRLVFGSRFIGTSFGRLLEVLPGTSYSHIRNRTDLLRAWLIDICAQHEDNRQVIFKQDEDRTLEAVFIDHGHLFGPRTTKMAHRCVSSRYLDRRIYGRFSDPDMAVQLSVILNTDFEPLFQSSSLLPEEWRTGSSMRAFNDCLDSLHDVNILRRVAEVIQSDLGGDFYSEADEYLGMHGANAAVLYSPLPETGRGGESIEPVTSHCLGALR